MVRVFRFPFHASRLHREVGRKRDVDEAHVNVEVFKTLCLNVLWNYATEKKREVNIPENGYLTHVMCHPLNKCFGNRFLLGLFNTDYNRICELPFTCKIWTWELCSYSVLSWGEEVQTRFSTFALQWHEAIICIIRFILICKCVFILSQRDLFYLCHCKAKFKSHPEIFVFMTVPLG